ncbi:MAG TPA: ribonuclease Y [Solirubrobacterales bacterium]|nr:ribonuclease Y [Solirubrobacterales bacterium]
MERRGRRKLASRSRPESPPLSSAAPAAESGPDGDSRAEGGDDLRARRDEIARLQERALHDAEAARLKLAELDRREQALADRERNLEGQAEELKRQKQVQRKELERLSGLTATQAKQMLIADVEHDARRQAGRVLIEVEEEAKREADRRARNLLSIAMGRLAGTHASETTTRLIELPSEEMKGRIIGREGRNIRAIEALTGVDVIIDETPNAVVLSSFDGVRREVARLALERLIADGRIQPATIEEAYEKAKAEVERTMVDAGERAELEAGVHGIDPELLEVLGRLRFRTSYGQNVLDHLVESSQIAATIAAELGASVETARRATLLHDIGKAVSHEVEGSHAIVGASMARRKGESDAVAHAIEAHHNEVEPKTVEAVIVQIADAVSGARPGARGEALEHYVTRLRDLEEVAGRHPGVEKVYAVRAGRELRLMVDPGVVDDEEAAVIARRAAKAIEKELDYPGRIKVTVVRETRATEFAD